MISVQQAKQFVDEQVETLQSVKMNIEDAVDFILAENIFSPIDIPSFNQASMDGYAVFAGDRENRRYFKLSGEVKAGDKGDFHLHEGEAVRIFTGAAVPVNADAVIVQEKATELNGVVNVDGSFHKGAYIRQKSAQTKKGDLAIKKSSVLTPAAIAHIASLGMNEILVYRKPCISIVVTGNEIVSPGNTLLPGQVFESNSFSIRAALTQFRIPVTAISMVRDDRNELKRCVEENLAQCDILLVTGGISVGKYDLVEEILGDLEVKTIFYKISQKPGKPMYMGKLGSKIIFALPGNPASVLVCFYEYVFPAIRKMMGYEKINREKIKMKTSAEIINNEGRACFIRAKMENDKIHPLEGQDSYMLHSFSIADAFIFIPGDKKQIHEGEEVEVHPIPGSINCY